VRITLLIAVFLHIYFTVSLALENRRARPQGYRERDYIKASYASRHMVVSGLVVLVFVVAIGDVLIGLLERVWLPRQLQQADPRAAR